MTSRCRLPLYAVLDVDQDADTDAIERAYRATVKEYHPDVFEHDSAQGLFVWATRAESVLSDASRRQRYDRVGHARFCEQAGWTSSNCPAAEAAAVYWSEGARERDTEGGSSSGSDTDGSRRDVAETSDSIGEASTRADARPPGGAECGDETRTGTGAGATARSGGGDTAGAGTGATAGTGRAQSTSGAARSRETATDGPRRGHSVASETQRSTGVGANAQSGRSDEPGGASAWARPGAATADYGPAHRAEELYFRNIAQVDADRGSGGASWESHVAPVLGVVFSLGVLFGSLALILYAL
jgi:curved DNA-binding protein CbpA